MKLLLLFIAIPCILGQSASNEDFLSYISRYCSVQQGGGSISGPPRVGKAGPRGISGAKGEPGIVNYDTIDRKITDKFEELNTNVNTRLVQFSETLERTTQCCRGIARLEADLLKMRTEILLEASGWSRARNGHFYKFFPAKINWQSAKADCRSKEANLASVGLRNSAVRREVTSYAGGRNFWIGVSDIAEEGRWIWEDGVESTGDDVGWNRNEPSNSGGNEDCAYLYSSGGLWVANDIPCGGTVTYLCEKIL